MANLLPVYFEGVKIVEICWWYLIETQMMTKARQILPLGNVNFLAIHPIYFQVIVIVSLDKSSGTTK